MGLLIMVAILVVALLLGVYVAAIIFLRTSKQDPAFDDDHKTFESSDLEFEESYQKALGYVSQGDPSEALTEIKECVRLQPSSAKAFNLMGDCYNALNQLDDGAYAYGESIKLSSQYVDPKLGMAEIWVKRGELQSAIDLCQEVIEHTKYNAPRSKERAEAYFKIGLIYMLGNHKSEAMDCYRELQQMDEESANRLFERIHQDT